MKIGKKVLVARASFPILRMSPIHVLTVMEKMGEVCRRYLHDGVGSNPTPAPNHAKNV